MTGFEKLREAVYEDIKNTIEQKGEIHSRDAKDYCDKFSWIIKRAKHYSKKSSLKWQVILDKWEEKRSYWYMNYYQEANQPKIEANRVKIFDTIEDFKKSVANKGFRCPYCNEISTNPQKCNSGKLVKLLNTKGKHTCNWSSGGLLGTLGKGISIFIKEDLLVHQIFMPVAWEEK